MKLSLYSGQPHQIVILIDHSGSDQLRNIHWMIIGPLHQQRPLMRRTRKL